MIPRLRSQFNDRFTEAAYSELLALLDRRCGGPIQFPVAETPIFVSRSLLDDMAEQGAILAHHLIADAAYLAAARRAIPHGYGVANETPYPHFLTADFALVRTASGELASRLVEIQAFPSVFAYQAELGSAYREAFGLPDTLGIFLGGLDESTYCDLLKRTILGNHKPEEVVLTEIDPLHQKTFADFHLTSKGLGIPLVDITSIEAVGDKLHYRDAVGRLRPIHRIYNRAIADELIARDIRLPFDLGRPWQVEWAGHPNWYFRISKFSIPYLDYPTVPPAIFLSDWHAGRPHNLPEDRNQWILKPLYSFAGKGIHFAPTQADLNAVPFADRNHYLLQQRVHFENVIDTPEGPTQPEIRILYAWPNGGRLTAMTSLIRMGRGLMMGVDHNRDKTWVGSSAGLYLSGNHPLVT